MLKKILIQETRGKKSNIHDKCKCYKTTSIFAEHMSGVTKAAMRLRQLSIFHIETLELIKC